MVSRRQFLKFCSVMTATLALPLRFGERIAWALEHAPRPSVVWLEFQDCAGDTESFLRSSHPTPGQFILDLVSLDYHETVMAPSGAAAEKSLHDALAKDGYILVVEGSIPLAAGGVYCTVAGKSAVDTLKEAAKGAAAVIAVGTCSSFGGLAAAAPNPTGAVGVGEVVTGVPILNLPGCPVNATNLSAVLVHYLTFGALPAMDEMGRPLFAYGGLIHDNCPRRAHFDAGRFVLEWGDQGHRDGWCLYRMGCKGPESHSNCPIVGWNDNTSWPVGAGHPCIACTEPEFWDLGPFYSASEEQAQDESGQRRGTPVGVALGLGGAAVAAAGGIALMARQHHEENDGKGS